MTKTERMVVIIPRTDKEQLEILAQKDRRSLSNLVVLILAEYLEKNQLEQN